VIHGLVLWPVPGDLAKEREWRIPGGKPIYRVGSSLGCDDVFDQDAYYQKGALARPMVLPISDISSLSFLTALATDCDPEVFATEELATILDELWDSEIKYWFVLDFGLYCVFFLFWGLLVTHTNVSDSTESFRGEYLEFKTGSLWAMALALNLLYGTKEFLKFRAANDWYINLVGHTKNKRNRVLRSHSLRSIWPKVFWSIREHFEDWWNICDSMTQFMVFVSLLLQVWRTRVTLECSVITTFLVLLKFLGYLRGFSGSAWVLRVLYKVFVDSRGIISVISSILLGFAVMFRILLGPYEAHFATYIETFFSMFEIGILGSFNREKFKQTQNPVLTMMLFFILLVVVYIVALNSYIALLNDSYGSVRDSKVANRNYQRASLIVSYLKLMGPRWRRKVLFQRRYFFALVPSNHEDVVAAADAFKLLYTKRKLQMRITEEARTEHKNTVMMRDEIASMRESLEMLTMQVAELRQAVGIIQVDR